jgi:hypothetical protein
MAIWHCGRMVIKPPSPPCSDTPVVLAFSNRRAQKESVGYPYESRHLGHRPTISDLPLKTDLVRAGCHVSKVPPRDSCTVAIERRRRSAKDHQLPSCRPLLVPSYKISLMFGDAALSQPSSTNRSHFRRSILRALYLLPSCTRSLGSSLWLSSASTVTVRLDQLIGYEIRHDAGFGYASLAERAVNGYYLR